MVIDRHLRRPLQSDAHLASIRRRSLGADIRSPVTLGRLRALLFSFREELRWSGFVGETQLTTPREPISTSSPRESQRRRGPMPAIECVLFPHFASLPRMTRFSATRSNSIAVDVLRCRSSTSTSYSLSPSVGAMSLQSSSAIPRARRPNLRRWPFRAPIDLLGQQFRPAGIEAPACIALLRSDIQCISDDFTIQTQPSQT